MLLIILTYIMHVKTDPFEFSELNMLEGTSVLCSGVTIYAGLYYLVDSMSEWAKVVLFSIIVLVNIVFTGFWVTGFMQSQLIK